MRERHPMLETGDSLEGNQYVRFALAGEDYAVEAISVQEIVKLGKIRRVPHLPEFFKGVINLRGAIIPVIDLKLRFGMGAGEYHDHTCIVITECAGGVIGLIVDEVTDVVRLSEESISERPSFGTTVRTDFLKGVGNADDAMVIILDVDRILSVEEARLLDKTRETVEAQGDAPEE